jgi:hypothetical protein
MQLLSQINKVFGGELWINGVLCFKDGLKRVMDIYIGQSQGTLG